jgi:hypothetical protein
MPSAENQIQIVDTHETSETLVVTRLQRVGYQINRTLLTLTKVENAKARTCDGSGFFLGIGMWTAELCVFLQYSSPRLQRPNSINQVTLKLRF